MHSRLPRGVRPRFEGKPRTPLSSRVATRGSWSPLSGLKGVQPPLPFGERTRDCSPGHAGKEGPQLARTGASQGFPRAAAPVGVFSRSTTRISCLPDAKRRELGQEQRAGAAPEWLGNLSDSSLADLLQVIACDTKLPLRKTGPA